jgi:uroporphyrinogen III methyltransferase / synthase
VFLVGAGPGDPGLITLKGRRALARADVVVCDTLIDTRLLEHCRAGTRLVRVGKRKGERSFPQARVTRRLIREARAGRTVVRLKCGDPFVFGRGGEEAAALARAGVPFDVVPGVSAGIAVPAYAGIPLTHRTFGSELVFLTAHECAAGTAAPVDWARQAPGASTLVIFMGGERLAEVAQKLLRHGRDPECPVAVISAGTTDRQRTIVAPLREIVRRARALKLDDTVLIVVGEVVRMRETVQWFRERAGGA